MTAQIPPTGLTFLALTGSGIVKSGPGILHMVKVSSSAGLTIKLWANTAASGTVLLNTMAVLAGEEHYLPAAFTALYIEFVAGTGAVTAFFI